MIELKFLKELILIKRLHQKSVISVNNGIFQTEGSSFNRMYAINVMIY